LFQVDVEEGAPASPVKQPVAKAATAKVTASEVSPPQVAATACPCTPLIHFQPKPAEKKDKVAPKAAAAAAAAPQKGIMSFFGKK